MRRFILVAALAVFAGMLLVGCGGQPRMSEEPVTGTYDEPQWVSKGVHAFPDEVGVAFYGVGVAGKSAIPDVYLRQKTAIERARGDVASQLRTFVTAVFKDYVEAVMSQGMDEGEVRSMTSNVQKSVTDEVLIGAERRDFWKAPNGDTYALVRLGMDSVAQQLKDKIAEVEKERLRVDAEAAHKELDEIIEKNRKALR
jgi:hypothetical protein